MPQHPGKGVRNLFRLRKRFLTPFPMPVLLLLCACSRPPAPEPTDAAPSTTAAAPTLLTGPTGWHPVAPGQDPHCLARLEPDDAALRGALLELTAWEVPGLDDVVLASDYETRLKHDLPQAWGKAGYELLGSRRAKYGSEELVVFDARVADSLGALRGRHYCTHRGTTQYVLSGWAPEAVYQQLEPVFEAAAMSLNLPSGAES